MNDNKLIKTILSLISDALLEDEEIAKEYLIKQGIDPAQVTNEFLLKLKMLKNEIIIKGEDNANKQ